MELTNTYANSSNMFEASTRHSPLSSSFHHDDGEAGREEQGHPPPISAHFSNKKVSSTWLPGLKDALESLRDGEFKLRLHESDGVFSRPTLRNVLPVLA